MVDGSGVPHVAYNSSFEELWHASLTAGRWEAELVDVFARGWRKAWVQGSPEPQLVYDALTFSVAGFHSVRSAPRAWTVEALVFGEKSAGASAVWREDRLQVARLVTTSEEISGNPRVRHGLVFDGQHLPTAYTRLATEAVVPQLAVAMDGNGTAHIVYTAPADDAAPTHLAEEDLELSPSGDASLPYTVRYVSVRNAEWSAPVVLSGPGASVYEGLAIAVDAADTVHVGFSGPASSGTQADGTRAWALQHFSRGVAAEWTGEVIPVGARARSSRGSLALDQAGEPHFAYCFVEEGQPRCSAIGYAYRRAGRWQVEAIEGGCDRVGEDAALALGTQGQVFVAYRGCEGELMLAERPLPDLPASAALP